MASPITWRNVEAPDLRGAASMLQLASNGFNSGFDKLNQVLQNEQATAESNWKVQRDNNTQAFLNSINQYRTPEEYQAALASGALDASKYGGQIDQAATRSALDGRLAILQDRAVKAGQFEDQQKAREAKPIVDQLSMMALSDDKDVRASAKAALTPYMEAGMLPNGAELAGKIRMTDRQNTEWDQADTRFANDTEKHKAEMDLQPGRLQAQQDAHLNAAVSRRLHEAQIESTRAEAGTAGYRAFQKQNTEQLKRFREDNAYGKDFSTDPSKNVSIIADTIQSQLGKVNPQAAQKISKFVAENPYLSVEDVSGNKVQLPLNSAVVSRAIQLVDTGKKDSKIPFMSSEGYGDDYVAKVQGKIQELMSEGAKDGKADSMLNSYATLQQLTANSLQGPVSRVPGGAIPPPSPRTEQVGAPSPASTALDRAAASTPPSSAPSSVDPQKVLAEVSAKNPKADTYWVNGERYKYQSVTDSDNNVTGNAWVKDTGTGGMFSSGVTNARVRNGYSGEDRGTDIRSASANAESLKAALKNVGGVTNAPASAPKVSAPIAGNIGQAPVKVKESSSVAYTPEGVYSPIDQTPAPSKAAIKSLTDVREVVTAYKGAIPKGEGTKVRVTVGDGDTFKFFPTDAKQAVPNAVGNVCRFDVIDAPETAHPSVGKRGQPYGREAADYLRGLIDNKEVTLKVFGQDKRKDAGPVRNICQVEIEGKAIDLEMVKAGFAVVFDEYINNQNPRYSDLKSSEARARTRQVGMFEGGGYVESPKDFRRRERIMNK